MLFCFVSGDGQRTVACGAQTTWSVCIVLRPLDFYKDPNVYPALICKEGWMHDTYVAMPIAINRRPAFL